MYPHLQTIPTGNQTIG